MPSILAETVDAKINFTNETATDLAEYIKDDDITSTNNTNKYLSDHTKDVEINFTNITTTDLADRATGTYIP